MQFFIGIILILFGQLLYSDTPTATFNIKEANQQFNKIKLNLALPNTPLTEYQAAIETLSTLLEQANQCTEYTQKELDNLESFIKQSKQPESTSNSVDLVYLNNQQKKWADIQAQCRLFTIRATEALNIYKRTAFQLKEKATLARGIPLWTLYHTISQQNTSFSLNIIKNNLLDSQIIVGLSGILTCSIFLALLFLYSFKKSKFSKRYLHFSHIKLLYIFTLSLSIFFGIGAIFFGIRATTLDEDNIFLFPISLLASYFFTWFLLIYIFKVQSFRSLMKWYNLNYRFARAALFFILNAFVVAYLGLWLNENQVFTPTLWQFYQTLYLYSVLIISYNYVAYYCHTNRQRSWVRHHARSFQTFIFLILLIPAVFATLGYITLGLQLLFAGFVLLTILFFMAAVILGIEKLYLYINTFPTVKQKITSYFGYKSEQTLTEFLILKVTLQLVTLILGIFLIAKATGFSNEAIEIAYEQFINGLHIGNITIYPIRIVWGIVIFCLIYLGARALSTKISGHQQFEDEEETQIAVASILTYLGFALAFIIGALIAGFDFTGLAIIAGALSVGIGLGLQSIVNNFVSGLILLIEKPIKPGDRISIDNIEGVVKKIRVRSTQIITGAREDVIIPNSDLITRRVVNFMLTDKYCRLSFNIEVAYDSDTYLVQNTLLEIANQHDDVIKTERNKPAALLHAFGENALIFQLTCLIKDVNKKGTVRSDINLEINRVFKERHINMPFTQREIHLSIDNFNQLKKLTKK